MTTSEEFFRERIKEEYQVPQEFALSQMNNLNAEKAMRWAQEYSVLKAKYYVEEALKSAAEKAEVWVKDYNDYEVDIDSILNSYDLDNIK